MVCRQQQHSEYCLLARTSDIDILATVGYIERPQKIELHAITTDCDENIAQIKARFACLLIMHLRKAM